MTDVGEFNSLDILQNIHGHLTFVVNANVHSLVPLRFNIRFTEVHTGHTALRNPDQYINDTNVFYFVLYRGNIPFDLFTVHVAFAYDDTTVGPYKTDGKRYNKSSEN